MDITTDIVGKSHQIAIFIDGSSSQSPEFWERANRVIQSFNHNATAKADVFSLTKNGSQAEIAHLAFNEMGPGNNVALVPWEKVPASDVSKWAEGMGFNTTVFVTAAGQEFN